MERKYWIDWAKVFGIFLVVLGHSVDGSMMLWKWIYSFHMPFFFLISGYLDKSPDSNLTAYVKKISKRLLVPYFIFGSAAILLCTQPFDIQNIAMGGVKMMLGRPTYFAAPLWFVFTLFEVKMLSAFVNVASLKKKWVKYVFWGLMLCFFVTVVIMHLHGDKPHWIFTFLIAYSFFAVGKIVRRQEDRVVLPSSAWVKTLTVVLALLFPFANFAINGTGDMHDPDFGNSVLMYYLLSTISSLAMLYFFRLFFDFKSGVIVRLSEGTILIVALHYLMLNWLHVAELPVWLRVAICALVVLAFYFPILFCERYCPILIGKTKYSR